MAKARYVLYTLYTRCDGNLTWLRRIYTRHALASIIARSIIEGKSILNNLEREPFKLPTYKENMMAYFALRNEKRYCILLETGNKEKEINISKLEKEAIDLIPSIKKVKERRQIKARFYYDLNHTYKFRKGNVPGINSIIYHRGGSYSISKMRPTIKEYHLAEIDAKDYLDEFDFKLNISVVNPNKTRKAYRKRYKLADRSWKSCKKIKKQWMKHLDTHVDTGFPLLEEECRCA